MTHPNANVEIASRNPYRWAMLTYLFLINLIFNGAIFMVMPPLFPSIAAELHFNYEQIGSLWGSNFLGMMFFTLVGGVAADRMGVKKAISISIFLASIIVGLIGLGSGYFTLWTLYFLLGSCAGFLVPNLFKTVTLWFGPNELSRANGILMMGSSIGMSIGLLVGAPMNAVLGNWRNVMTVNCGIGILFVLMWVAFAREKKPIIASSGKLDLLRNLKDLFKIKEMWLLCFIELISFGCFLAILGVLPSYLIQKGLSASMAGLVSSIPTWATLVAFLMGPYFSDRIGLRKIFIWPGLLIASIMITVFAFAAGPPLYLALGIFGFALGWAWPPMRSIIGELDRIGPALTGNAFGCLLLFNRIGCFLFPWLLGFVITTRGNTSSGFYSLALLMLLCPVLILFAKETGKRRSKLHAKASPARPINRSL